MRSRSMWKRISTISICLVLLPITTFCVLFYYYTSQNVFNNARRAFIGTCKTYADAISEHMMTIRMLAYDTIYSKDMQLLLMRKLSAWRDDNPDFTDITVDRELESYIDARLSLLEQRYASTIQLTLENGSDRQSYIAGIDILNDLSLERFVAYGNLVEDWTGVRGLTLAPPYSGVKYTISYYRTVTPYATRGESVLPRHGWLRIDIPELSVRSLYANNTEPGLIFNYDGQIISSSRQARIGRNLSATFDRELSQNLLDDTNTAFEYTIDGVRCYVVSRYIPYTNWRYVSYMPIDTMMYDSAKLAMWIVAVFIGSCMFIVFAQMLSARRITRPLMRLAKRMDSMHQEEGAQIGAPRTGDEIAVLETSFENLNRRIERLTSEVYEAQMEELRARLRFLQSQINPHFLYNTLDNIRFSARLDGDMKTGEQIEALSDIFRSMTSGDTSFVTLREELDISHKYITLMNHQLDMEVTVHENIAPELLSCYAPKFILQPLLENSYGHGLRNLSRERGNIWIDIESSGELIIVRVADDGVGIDAEKVNELIHESGDEGGRSHLALHNIHRRLVLYFGEDYGISIENRTDGGALVLLRMPVVRERQTNGIADTDSRRRTQDTHRPAKDG